MMKELFPPVAIGIALVCGCMILLIFALLHRVLPVFRESALRLGASVGLAVGIWVVTLVAAQASGLMIHGADIAAGAAVLLSAAICAFLLISLLTWGFTISIARDLGAAGRSMSLAQWKAAFANGSGFDAFARDRIALLLAMGVVAVHTDRLKLTARGRLISSLARIGMIYFGVERNNGSIR